MKPGTAETHAVGSPEVAPVASRYETLRMAALGEPVPPEYRRGLVIFLRLSMWGWARALASAIAAQQPARSSSTISTAPRQQRAVIQVFAAMAMDSNNRRAR